MSFKPLFGTPLKRDHWAARDLAACWLFNEGTGRYVWDATGNGNDGICTNMADPPTATSGWGPGPHGGALLFDGTNDYVVTADAPGLDISGTAPFAISSLVKSPITSATDNVNIAGMTETGNAGLAQDKRLFINTLGKFVFQVYDGVSKEAISNVANDGGWHHLTGVFTGSLVILYVDGVAQSATAAATGSYNFASLQLLIGGVTSDQPGADVYFSGAIDHVQVRNIAPSAGEVAYLSAFPYAMFEEEAFPAWMIPPLASGRYYRQLMAGGR